MNSLVKDKSFYKSLAAIALPIALQNIIGFGVQLMDTIMVGSLGDISLSGVSLANQPFFVFMIFNFGLASGGAVLIAQYWGRKNVDAVRRIMGISMRFVVIAAVVFTLICNVIPEKIVGLFSAEKVVIAEGVRYLKVVSFSYLFYGLSSCYLNSMRAVEKVVMSTVVYVVSFFINVLMNWIFIFGKLGAPALGVVGAAVGTLAARFTEFLMVAVYMHFIEKDIRFHFSFLLKTERQLLPDYLRHSLPVVGSELIWSLGTVVQTAIIGNIGSVFVSANSIAAVVQQLAQVMLFGVGNAAAVLIGKTVGGGKIEAGKKMAKTILLLAFGLGLFSCGLIFLIRRPLAAIYNVTPEAKALAVDIMGVMGAIMVASAVEVVCIIGILRGAGDTRFAFVVDAGCVWFIGVPMGYLAGFVWKLPVLLVYVCLRSDLPVRLAICLVRIFRGRYIKNVTREI